MREIISLNFGNFGSKVGHLFNQKLAEEHGLTSKQSLPDISTGLGDSGYT